MSKYLGRAMFSIGAVFLFGVLACATQSDIFFIAMFCALFLSIFFCFLHFFWRASVPPPTKLPALKELKTVAAPTDISEKTNAGRAEGALGRVSPEETNAAAVLEGINEPTHVGHDSTTTQTAEENLADADVMDGPAKLPQSRQSPNSFETTGVKPGKGSCEVTNGQQPQSELDSNSPAGICTSPLAAKSSANNASPLRADSRVYRRAKRVTDGMHRFHLRLKYLSFLSVGLVLWANDAADAWVSHSLSVVDSATQGAVYAWTFGWLSDSPPALSPWYQRYNFVMTVLAAVGLLWATRWFVWNEVLKMLEAGKSCTQSDLRFRFFVIEAIWLGQYILAGEVAKGLLSASVCPFTIPSWPSHTTRMLGLAVWITAGILGGSIVADDGTSSS